MILLKIYSRRSIVLTADVHRETPEAGNPASVTDDALRQGKDLSGTNQSPRGVVSQACEPEAERARLDGPEGEKINLDQD